MYCFNFFILASDINLNNIILSIFSFIKNLFKKNKVESFAENTS